MFKSRINRLLRNTIICLLAGVIGIRLFEPSASWLSAMLWVEKILVSFDSDRFPASSPASDFFQSHFALLVFVLITVLLTEIIPLYIDRSNAPSKGLQAIVPQRGRPLYLLVNPVDWEKARSMAEALKQRMPSARLVVASETLSDIPTELLEANVRWVSGCLREFHTYQLAGVDHAVGAWICAASYDDPDKDVIAAFIVKVLEHHRPSLRTVVEAVSRENLDLFGGAHRADHVHVFDAITLQATCQRLKALLGERPARIRVQTVDRLQTAELITQLRLAGVNRSRDHRVSVDIILPEKLDDPSLSDAQAHAKLLRSKAEVQVVLYLSVLSQDGFANISQAVCADRVVAEELVDTMLG